MVGARAHHFEQLWCIHKGLLRVPHVNLHGQLFAVGVVFDLGELSGSHKEFFRTDNSSLIERVLPF